ncbi:hypothetical protein D3C78_1613320 [compost metagenome]
MGCVGCVGSVGPIGVFSTHLAYRVMFPVTLSVERFHAFLNVDSLYQPLKTYPVLAGMGVVIALPLVTFVRVETSLPPLLLNVTV